MAASSMNTRNIDTSSSKAPVPTYNLEQKGNNVKPRQREVTSENLCQRQEGVLAMWFCRLTKGAPPCRTRQRSGVYRVHLLS